MVNNSKNEKEFKKHAVAVILGTGREGRMSERVARFIFSVLEKRFDIEPIFVDVRDYIFGRTIPKWQQDSRTKPWIEVASRADGFVIVSPEYNHSYPGELKMLLDQAFEEYKMKPAIICGVSNGQFGGARGADKVRDFIAYLGMVQMKPDLLVIKVTDIFTEDNKSKSPEFEKNLDAAVSEMIEYLNHRRR